MQSSSGNDDALVHLMRLGAPIGASKISCNPAPSGRPPALIDISLARGRTGVIDELIARGALNTAGVPDQKKIDSAFRKAIESGRLALVQKIWAIGGDQMRPSLIFDSVTSDQKQPQHASVPVTLLLHTDVWEREHWDGLPIAKWLAERGCDLKASTADGTNLLQIATQARDAEFIRYLLAQGFDPLTPGHHGLPALGSADDEDIALILLEAGTTMKSFDDGGEQFRKYSVERHWGRVAAWLAAHNE